MKEYSFTAIGHENILASHRNTIEFTKDDFLTKTGDCIIGIKSNFDLDIIKAVFLNRENKIKMIISSGGFSDTLYFIPNPSFSSEHEMVIRKTDFTSDRTLGIFADKAAKDLDRDLVNAIRLKDAKITITLR